jgi:hypothetical protein
MPQYLLEDIRFMIEARTSIGTLKVKGPEIHIYKFSRLVGAEAGKWEKLLKELESKEDVIYRYYQPVREAAVKLASRAGKGRDAIYQEMTLQAESVIHSPNQNPIKDNQTCFSKFENIFLPKIQNFKVSLLRTHHGDGTYFNGVILKGLPHMIVTDQKDRERYVYLYPSNWKEYELDSYLELLTIIIESEYGAVAKDIWCRGLRNGESVAWTKSKVRVRQKCQEAARLYKRMSILASNQ